MKRVLMNMPCEFTHTASCNTKAAALSVAKSSANLSVAALFGFIVLATDVIPAMKKEKHLSEQMGKLERRYTEELFVVVDKLKALEHKAEEERKGAVVVVDKLKALEEKSKKKGRRLLKLERGLLFLKKFKQRRRVPVGGDIFAFFVLCVCFVNDDSLVCCEI